MILKSNKPTPQWKMIVSLLFAITFRPPIPGEKMNDNQTIFTHPLSLHILALALIFLGLTNQALGNPMIEEDAEHKLVTLSDGDGQLTLRLNYNNGCILDRVIVRGRSVATTAGSFTGICASNQWFSSGTATGVNVNVGEKMITVEPVPKVAVF